MGDLWHAILQHVLNFTYMANWITGPLSSRAFSYSPRMKSCLKKEVSIITDSSGISKIKRGPSFSFNLVIYKAQKNLSQRRTETETRNTVRRIQREVFSVEDIQRRHQVFRDFPYTRRHHRVSQNGRTRFSKVSARTQILH